MSSMMAIIQLLESILLLHGLYIYPLFSA
jgi:hypothetical protein